MAQIVTKVESELDPKSVFVHESSHAVVGKALGYELDYIHICRDRKTPSITGGGVRFMNQEFLDRDLSADRESTAIRMAGRLAEDAICPPVSIHGKGETDSDLEHRLCELGIEKDKIPKVMMEAGSAARHIIATNIEVIRSMADIIGDTVERFTSRNLYSRTIPCLDYLRDELQKVVPYSFDG